MIESGIGRLGIPEFDSKREMDEINRMMLGRATDREQLRARWQKSLREIHGEMEVAQVEAVPKEEVQTGYLFVHALGMETSKIARLYAASAVWPFLSYGRRSSALPVVLGIGMICRSLRDGQVRRPPVPVQYAAAADETDRTGHGCGAG